MSTDHFRMMGVVNQARLRYWALPAVVHTDDPRTAYGRVLSATVGDGPSFSHESAVNLAALALSLVAAVERSEQASPFTGGEAA